MNKEKNSEYWRGRFKQLQDSLLRPADDYISELENAYITAEKSIEIEISLWYQRFADNNGIVDMAEARRLLNSSELKELKWDLNEYIKYGRENAINQKWVKELENASARVHIRRLEAIKLQSRQAMEKLYGGMENKVDSLIKNTYSDSFYKTAFEIAKGTGIGTSLVELDENMLDKIAKKPWAVDEKSFSQRIWGYKTTAINTIYNELNKGLMSGKTVDEISKSLAKAAHVKESYAKNLVLTESAYFSSLGGKDCFNELGVEKYEVLGTLDGSTCSECGGLDGKVYDMKEYEIGVNAPLFHCRCRCTTVPYFDDEFTQNEKRAARDKDGKTILVDSKIKYDDWKKEFVGREEEKYKAYDTEENNVANQKKNDIINTEDNIMSLEYQRYGRNKDTLVNSAYINSGEYRNKFDKITDNKNVNRVLYSKAKEMLQHRSGTMLEDMYWIDGDTGEVVASVLDSQRESQVIYSDSIKNKILGKSNLITLHNHPSSMPPSVADINSTFRNAYYNSLVICHDGRIFKYSSSQEIDIKLYEAYLRKFLKQGILEYEAQWLTLKKLRENHQINFEEVL